MMILFMSLLMMEKYSLSIGALYGQPACGRTACIASPPFPISPIIFLHSFSLYGYHVPLNNAFLTI